MVLAVGRRLGPYEVLGLFEAGGMEELYRARRTRLGRAGAIKTVDAPFTERFECEARTLASLNHPNVAQIHGFEESDGINALVMEPVEGPTLADRISQGPIPLDGALPIATQTTEALEAAHAPAIETSIRPATAPAIISYLASDHLRILRVTGHPCRRDILQETDNKP